METNKNQVVVPGNEDTHKAEGSTEGATVVSVGSMSGFSGLGGIIDVLLLVCAWCVVGIGYLCVPGSIVAAVLGFVCAVMNVTGGLASAAMCLGIGVACVGLCYPIFVGTRFLQNGLLKRDAKVGFRANLLTIGLVIAVLGAVIAGFSVLMGAGDSLVLPAFLQAVFEN